MNKIVCEMCGSNNLIKKEGVFVCENCGTKYTLEEARKMMIDGIVNVKINKKEENALLKKRADEAFKNEEWLEAVKLYSEFLKNADGDYETNYKFVLSKAKCNGTIYNGLPYTGKSVTLALSKFIDYANELKNDPSIDYNEKTRRITLASWMIESSIWWIFNRKKDTSFTSLNSNEFYTYKTYVEFTKVLEECFDYYKHFFKVTIEACKYIPELVIDRINRSENGYNLLSWYDFTYTELYTKRNFLLSESGKEVARQFKKCVDDYLATIKEIETNYKQHKIEKYWNEHPEEKTKLENNKKRLIENLTQVKKQIEDLPLYKTVAILEKELSILKEKRDSLGFFNFKDKKELSNVINDKNAQLIDAKKQLAELVSSLEKEIASLNKDICKIEDELNKER